jgi:hypothetical protein
VHAILHKLRLNAAAAGCKPRGGARALARGRKSAEIGGAADLTMAGSQDRSAGHTTMVLYVILFPVTGFVLLTWVLAGDAWHPLMLTLFVIGVVAQVIYSLRWIVMNERAVKLTSRPLDVYVWQQTWNAAEFLHHFELYLRVRGWRIIDAAADGADRFRLVADKSKDRIALLGVRPGQAVTADDFTGLDALRHRQRVTRAALVMEGKPTQQDVSNAMSRNCLVLRFEDLDFIENALNIAG